MSAELTDKLNDVFRQVFKDDTLKLTPETTANDVDGWDSFSHITLLLAIESRFNVKLSHKEVLSFRNVGDMLACLEKKTAG